MSDLSPDEGLAAGDFQQGTPTGADALAFEMPQHKVMIAHPFAAGVYDVTVGEYAEFVAQRALARVVVQPTTVRGVSIPL